MTYEILQRLMTKNPADFTDAELAAGYELIRRVQKKQNLKNKSRNKQKNAR